MKKRPLAVIEKGKVVDVYPSLIDGCKATGICSTVMYNRVYRGKVYNGQKFVRTDYDHNPIMIFTEGKLYCEVPTLGAASRTTDLTEEQVLNLLDSGGEINGWSFDEQSYDVYPNIKTYRGRRYYKMEGGYKSTGQNASFLHRDMYRDEYGDLPDDRHLTIRNANRWNFEIDNLILP